MPKAAYHYIPQKSME